MGAYPRQWQINLNIRPRMFAATRGNSYRKTEPDISKKLFLGIIRIAPSKDLMRGIARMYWFPCRNGWVGKKPSSWPPRDSTQLELLGPKIWSKQRKRKALNINAMWVLFYKSKVTLCCDTLKFNLRPLVSVNCTLESRLGITHICNVTRLWICRSWRDWSMWRYEALFFLVQSRYKMAKGVHPWMRWRTCLFLARCRSVDVLSAFS